MAVPRQSWHLNDAGILRKKEEDDELLVFGYSCKIFRDDEKALFIDQGKHLIPWMGDESLKIDRYDGRAALADLRESEAPLGGYDLWASLSDAERRVEQLCDEERYRALTHNEEEEALYQEEELKRLQQALSAENTYGQVAYQYDETGQPVGEQKPEGTGAVAEEDEPFVAPQELDIPLNMVLPETVKANAIIEKTAMFINEQGAQMEILLKMKQSKNPQFQFLSYDDPLHTYYRHLLMAIKTGRYRPKPPKEEEEDEGDQDDEDDGYYLHPSLASSASRIELAPSIPSINYKPSADCAYSMLVNKIRDKQAAFVAEETANAAVAPVAPAPSAPASAQSDQESVEEEDAEEEEPEATGCVAYKGSREDTARTGKGDSANTCPVVSVGRKRRKRRGARRKRRNSGGGCGGAEKNEFAAGMAATPFLEPPPEMQIVIDKMASYVAKNGRDFETIVKSKGDPRFAFLDSTHQFNSYYRLRLQQYELQNAPATAQETPVPSPAKKAKKGPEKAQTEEKVINQSKSPEQTKAANQEKETNKSSTKLAPVCFSIKKPKEVEILPLEKRSALLLEETSEEEEGEEESEGKTEQTNDETESKGKIKQPVAERVEQSQPHQEVVSESVAVKMVQDVPLVSEEEKKEETSTDDVIIERQETVPVENEAIKIEEQTVLSSAAGPTKVYVEEQHAPHVIDDAEVEKDMFLDLGEANSPGGLSPASAANRERHLQQERKRKAAIFLRMIKKEHPPDVPSKPSQPPQGSDSATKGETSIETIIVEDDDSYSSIPSPPVTSTSKTKTSSPTVVRKDEWSFPSPAGGGQNGLSSYSSRDKPYRKYPSENDGRESSPLCHRRHHHHRKHKHRKEASSPISPAPTHKRARSRSKTRSDRPRKEGSSLSKHKKGKKKKARSRSRSRTRRHTTSMQGHHHHKKSKHHSRHKGKRREREEVDLTDDHVRRHRSRSRERKYGDRRKVQENLVDEGQTSSSSKGEKKRREETPVVKKEESSPGSSEDRSSGSESSDSRESAR